MIFDFSKALLAWFDQRGRTHLPWQQDKTPYRVWVSEIMLQQTQVNTVIDYYQRFMARFPDVTSLANASIDDVLALWAGLGYYTRAKNLHWAAQLVCDEHEGIFPETQEGLIQLPGIGRSTAAAISSICFGERVAIMDGNVRRVLARFHAIEGDPSLSAVTKQLWTLAEKHLPEDRIGDYTQAIMDLGAMICTRTKPDCQVCPMHANCEAFQTDRIAEFPGKKRKKVIPERSTMMLMLVQESQSSVMLLQRPLKGLWGGLYTLPEVESDVDLTEYCWHTWRIKLLRHEALDSFRHTFTHFHLDITPVYAVVDAATAQPRQTWYDLNKPLTVGVAKPVRTLITYLERKLCPTKFTV